METDIYVCVETASRRVVAVEIEPREYVRSDDPYFKRGVAKYLNQEFYGLGDVLSPTKLSEWETYKANANDRDTLYKIPGPKISTSIHIEGFRA